MPVKTSGKWLPVENVFSTLQDIWQEAERFDRNSVKQDLNFAFILRAGPVAEDHRVSYLTGTQR